MHGSGWIDMSTSTMQPLLAQLLRPAPVTIVAVVYSRYVGANYAVFSTSIIVNESSAAFAWLVADVIGDRTEFQGSHLAEFRRAVEPKAVGAAGLALAPHPALRAGHWCYWSRAACPGRTTARPLIEILVADDVFLIFL